MADSGGAEACAGPVGCSCVEGGAWINGNERLVGIDEGGECMGGAWYQGRQCHISRLWRVGRGRRGGGRRW